jgi:multiple sugar transport system permease protein
MNRSMEHRRNAHGWLFSSPYLLFTLIFFLLPLVMSVLLVFFDWNMISPEKVFVGLGNFKEALTSNRVWNAFLVSYKFMIVFVPGVMATSLILALIVNALPWFKSFFSVGFFLPYLVSGVALSLFVRGFLSYTSPLNVFLRSVFGSSPSWLHNSTLAVLVITAMIIWKMAGYYALILLAGLQGIPSDIYEAASLDGANSWQKFWSITVPMLYPALYTVLIMAVGLVFGIFTEPYVLTNGGPQLATQTWQLEIYYQAFSLFRSGYGATMALLNAVVTFVSIWIIRRIAESRGRRYGWN